MKKIYYLTVFVALLEISTIHAQELSKLTANIGGGNQNSVLNFNPATLNYTIELSSTQIAIPQVAGEPAAGSSITSITQATSITGAEAERTATVLVTAGGAQITYSVTFTKSDNFIEGFTDDGSNKTGSFLQASGSYNDGAGTNNHGECWGDRSCRAQSTAKGIYLTTPVLPVGAGSLTLWLTRYSETSDLQSKLQIKTSTNGGQNWTAVATIEAATYQFPAAGTWNKESFDISLNDANTQIQVVVIKDGVQTGLNDFRLDDIVITPYGTPSSVPSVEEFDENIYPSNGKIYIEGNVSNGKYAVYDIVGRLIDSNNYDKSATISVKQGIYVVKTDAGAKKVIVK